MMFHDNPFIGDNSSQAGTQHGNIHPDHANPFLLEPSLAQPPSQEFNPFGAPPTPPRVNKRDSFLASKVPVGLPSNISAPIQTNGILVPTTILSPTIPSINVHSYVPQPNIQAYNNTNSQSPDIQMYNQSPDIQAYYQSPDIQAYYQSPDIQAYYQSSNIQAYNQSPNIQAYYQSPNIQAYNQSPNIQAYNQSPNIQAPDIQTFNGANNNNDVHSPNLNNPFSPEALPQKVLRKTSSYRRLSTGILPSNKNPLSPTLSLPSSTVTSPMSSPLPEEPTNGVIKPPPRHRRARSNADHSESTPLQDTARQYENMEAFTKAIEQKWREEKEAELRAKVEQEVRQRLEKEMNEKLELEKRLLIIQNIKEKNEFVHRQEKDIQDITPMYNWWEGGDNSSQRSDVSLTSSADSTTSVEFDPFALSPAQPPPALPSPGKLSKNKNPFLLSASQMQTTPKVPPLNTAIAQEKASFLPPDKRKSLRSSSSAPLPLLNFNPFDERNTPDTSPNSAPSRERRSAQYIDLTNVPKVEMVDSRVAPALQNITSPRPPELKYLTRLVIVQSVVRMWLVRRSFLKQELQRKKALRELIHNERIFNQDLKTAIQVYLLPLKSAAEAGGSKVILPAQEIHSIFLNAEAILRASDNLIAKLESVLSRWSVFKCIGGIFMNPETEALFTAYVTSHQSSVKLAQSRLEKKASPFRKFVKEAEKRGAKHAGKDSAYNVVGAGLFTALRLPVDYLTNQVNFLKGVQINTYTKHSDRTLIQRWMAKSEEICAIDDLCTVNENNETRKMFALHDVLEKIEPKDKSLLVPGRYLIHEGDIKLVNSKITIKEYYYFLFNDVLMLTKKKKNKYQLLTVAQLRTAHTKEIPENHSFCGLVLTNAWELHTSKKSIIMVADTPTQKAVVLGQLDAVFSTLKMRRVSSTPIS